MERKYFQAALSWHQEVLRGVLVASKKFLWYFCMDTLAFFYKWIKGRIFRTPWMNSYPRRGARPPSEKENYVCPFVRKIYVTFCAQTPFYSNPKASHKSHLYLLHSFVSLWATPQPLESRVCSGKWIVVQFYDGNPIGLRIFLFIPLYTLKSLI